MQRIQSIDEFKSKVIEVSGRVLVDFSAVWCNPCRMLAPVLEELSAEYEGKVPFYTVDIDELRPLAQSYAVDAVPTLYLFEDGKFLARTVGLLPKEQIKEMIDDQSLSNR